MRRIALMSVILLIATSVALAETATVTCLAPNGGFRVEGQNFTVLTQGQTVQIEVRPGGSLVTLWSCGWGSPDCQWLPYTVLPNSRWEIVNAGGARIVMSAIDYDGDGAPAREDCDDFDPAIHPGALELPGNAVDEDCDGDLGECSPCLAWRNHGGYVSCVANAVSALVEAGSLTQREADALVTSAAQSKIGKDDYWAPECE